MTIHAELAKSPGFLEKRLDFLLERKEHCDRYLSRIADPRGKSVLVVGSGPGTEMLWALERGALSVTGIDPVPQPTDALDRVLEQEGLEDRKRCYEVLLMGVEDLDRLDRRFDLVLSNNVFEHLPDLDRAFEACSEVLVPGSGRLAIFADPLFYSSCGSHLEHEPWEHLWGDAEELADRLRRTLPEWHPLQDGDLEHFYRRSGLNRMRLQDFHAAVRRSGLAVLNLSTIGDRNLHRLGELLPRLRPAIAAHDLSLADLTVEGVRCELARIEPGTDEASGDPASMVSMDAARAWWLEMETIRQLRRQLDIVERVLRDVERSSSFRLGRAVTAPVRKLRDLIRRATGSDAPANGGSEACHPGLRPQSLLSSDLDASPHRSDSPRKHEVHPGEIP